MKRPLKIALIILNLIILIAAGIWYSKQQDWEPLIICIGQLATLAGLIFENQISGIITKKVDNSLIDVDVISGENVHTSKIKDSDIKIKTR